MVDPDTHEELDKYTKSFINASKRSTRSHDTLQPKTYDPKVVKLHKRPPKSEIYVTKPKDAMDVDDYGGDHGDGGDLCIHQAPVPLISGVIG